MNKKISLYGMLTALCIVLGYVEHLISFDFIAPGIKIGLANSLVLLLVAKKDFLGAVLVNTARIILSSLLFSSFAALMYSFAGAFLSMLLIYLLRKTDKISLVGLSVIGAVAHNLAQLCVAALLLSRGVWYYCPILIISAVISGFLTGNLATLVFKRSDR